MSVLHFIGKDYQSVENDLSPAPLSDGEGPFFSLCSRCEDNPSFMPYFVVMRHTCDILFPRGSVVRPFLTQREASAAARHCNILVARIECLCQLQQDAVGFLLFDALQRQAEMLIDEISAICFLTERELQQMKEDQTWDDQSA